MVSQTYAKTDLLVTQVWVDLFCGAGGVTNGLHNKRTANGGKIKVVVCVNHDINAIKSHAANHPECNHYTEDIKSISIEKIKVVIDYCRGIYPNAKVYLWASLECTSHSNAKGGSSRNADSRTLANHLFRYLSIGFDKVYIENVREFLDWGPLEHKIKDGKECYDKKGEPVMVPKKAFKADYYKGWEYNMIKHGFSVEKKILNCADYGCPTFRKRLFIQFSKDKKEIRWPKPTHLPHQHIAVSTCLDLNDYGDSVFRLRLPKLDANGKQCYTKKGKPIYVGKSPLSPNSIARINRGIVKFGPQQFLCSAYTSGDNNRGLWLPAPTITTVPKAYLVSQYLCKYYKTGDNTVSIDLPSPTLTTKDRLSLTSAFLMDYQYDNVGSPLHKPCPTLIARQDKKPLYLIQSIPGHILKHESDCYELRVLKRHCWKYGIGDIYIRSLKVIEMKRITTLGEDYILEGTETEQKKYVGNAVPSLMVTELGLVA